MPTTTAAGVVGGVGLIIRGIRKAGIGVGTVVLMVMFVPEVNTGRIETVRLFIVLAPEPLVIAAAVPLTVALPIKKGTEVLPP